MKVVPWKVAAIGGETSDNPAALPLLAVSAVLLGYVVTAGPAMWMLAAVLVILAFGVRPPGLLRISFLRAESVALAVMVAGLVWYLVLLLTRPPGFAVEIPQGQLRFFRGGVFLAAALLAASLISRGRLARVSFPLVLGVHLVLGVWLLLQSPSPGIDVYVWQDQALSGLIDGRNPYAGAYPEAHPGTYPEELVAGGRVSGYAYPPLTLLAALPAHVAGDLRYAYLLALETSALLIGYARPGRLARAAAALLLFTPGLFFVLELSWTEPVLIAAFAAAIFAACRKRTMPAAVLFGLALASKQYIVLSIALIHKLFGLPFNFRTHLRRMAVTAAVALGICLPWILWDPGALWRGLVEFPLKTPFRTDSFSFPAALVRAGSVRLPSWLTLLAPVLAWLLARRVPWTPSGFSAGTALILVFTFAWSTHAFSNYYFLAFAVLCCAVASVAPVGDRGESDLEVAQS